MENIMIYLNAGTARDGRIENYYSHFMLFNYLRNLNITMANGRPFLKSYIAPWDLQRSQYFKDFLIENINRENYSEFLTLLTQLSSSS